ncbi:hypothetical protein EUCA11A_10460 [Eubacterium callanderi]|uniref:hypothetical protein n=1 Tax=Eubacterium callanderi TaxID=53442 RepID=UPI0029FF4A8E|nr:hypothetical protein [Eubacterium callanderi]WPK66893.1 hypothetical protein EUCA2A_10460 [Eubacterium callanderi]WPK71191.1 hypothetical protein EUCA11A_10460 [Eubacterium callanderi]
MYTFESKETECYFYEIAKKYGIMHVNMENGAVMTRENVNLLANLCAKDVAELDKRAK